jgi:phosphatidylinositol alpha-mannosyltransferase
VGTFVILPDSGTSDLGIRILGRLLRRNLRLFDAFCGLSGPAAELATAAYGVAAHAIPGPIDVEAMRTQAAASPWPNPDGDHVIVTFLGRLVERKGVLELIAAVSAMTREAQSQMRVRIGGKGPLADDARRAIERAGLESCIRLDGFIADADKAGYLAAADIAIFPATGGESFGVVLVEAMAAGAGCVVAGDNPGYRWTMGDPDAMVNPRDPAALASALESWVRNPSQRALLHDRQRRRVHDFDAAVVGPQLEALYGLR